MNSIYNNLKSLKNLIYCFIATKSPEMISKILKESKSEWKELKSESDFKVFLFVNHSFEKEKGVISFSVINNLGDYDASQISAKLMNGEFISNAEIDSLISLSCINKQHFACMTDFWGIMTHYWSKSEDTFICSNNIFLISLLIGGKLSKDALYEYLFFLATRKDKTWFENIKCLLPGQQLIFNISKNSLKLSKSNDFSTLLNSHDFNLIETVEGFFVKAGKKIESTKKNYIGLSAGSDSHTILAFLRHCHINHEAISYGRNYVFETYKIKKFTKKYKIPWRLVNLEGFEDRFNELFLKGTLISNGLLNPILLHAMILYNQIEQENTLFEGILGSEFVKGEISEMMVSDLHRDVIVKGISIREAIEKYYPELSNAEKESMYKYINDNYGMELLDINSSGGLNYFQHFALETLPRKIFNGFISIELANGISSYYPFLSPKIICSIFSNKYGLSSSVSLRDDFPGSIKCLEGEAKIVQHADKKIFNSLLIRSIRFKHVLYPLLLAKWIQRFYFIMGRLTNYKHLMYHQMDQSKLYEIAKTLSNTEDLGILSLDKRGDISHKLLQRSLVTLSYILKVANSSEWPESIKKI
jgi:hypothetical protein